MENWLDTVKTKSLTEQDYIRLVYITLLGRKIDSVGLEYWIKKIETQSFNLKEMIDSIYSSPEFIMHYKIPFPTMVHKGRVEWIKSLEKFDTIFDIGGSSPNIEEGAMIELSYPHRAKSITIFDLPEEEQYWGKPKFPQDRDYNFEWGTLKYEHGRVETIDSYANLVDIKYDMVFMGQTIEHIYPDKLPIVLRWISGHLKTNGKFIFDTPNRIITKVQTPEKWIDEDHKHEYTPSEMESLLNRCGLKVTKKTGIVDMPDTLSSGCFNPLEVYDTELINNSPDSSYLFAFECESV
jgi:SAM-dependent methyltransferase